MRMDGLRYPKLRGDERNFLPDLKLADRDCDTGRLKEPSY
jgi:hypothetical protein